MKQSKYMDYVPAVRPEKMDEAIGLGCRFMEQNIPDWTPRLSLMQMQLRYVSPLFWLAQLLLIVLTVMVGLVSAASSGAADHEMAGRMVFQLAPVLCLVAVPELVKDLHYDMSELENCCKNDSSIVLQMRLLIVGLTDVVTLTLLAAVLAGSLQQDFLMTVIYAMAPFVWASVANLLILRALRIRGRLGAVFLTLLPVALAWVVPLRAGTFEAEGMVFWVAALATGAALLAAELMILKREMVREGVNQWN